MGDSPLNYESAGFTAFTDLAVLQAHVGGTKHTCW